jgi:hypothetical protein
MDSGPCAPPARAAPWASLEPCGAEAILPPGMRLCDETRPGRRCFVLLDGRATVAAGGRQLRPPLAAGAFVGSVDRAGRPQPLAGVTVQLTTQARVLVLDAARLAAKVDADPIAAAALRQLTRTSTGA